MAAIIPSSSSTNNGNGNNGGATANDDRVPELKTETTTANTNNNGATSTRSSSSRPGGNGGNATGRTSARSNASRASNRSGRPSASSAAVAPPAAATVVEMDNEASDSDDDTAAGGVNGHLHPDHPLLARMQAAIADQLSQAEVKLDLQQREKNASLTAIKAKREKYGVDLYSLQQKLAKLQSSVEKTQEQLQIETQAKIDASNELKRVTDEHANKVDESQQLHQKWISQQRDLDQLNVTVRQVTEFIGKVKSEILVTRRAAYGTEDNMQRLEKDKKKQDEIIDQLHERLKQMKEEIKLYDGQIAAQQSETKAAVTTLADAVKDMELIRIEQRDLLQKWKSALLGMANRDTALEAAEAALLKQQELLQTLDLERKGLKGTIKNAQTDNERLTGETNRLEAETKFVDGQLASLAAKRKELNERYTMLRSDMERADAALRGVKGTQRELKMSIDASHKSYEKLMQEKQKLDDQILENQSTQTTIEKGAQNVWKLAERLKAQTHEKEIKYGEIMNEVARIKVDSLNTGAHNKELKQTLAAYDKELREKDKLIEKYEMEIRQRHDKIEKKQIYIARLNKKFEALASNKQDDNTGPLEATIKNLLKEIASVNKETGELSREWIKTQTELVSLVSQTKTEYDLVDELNSRETILNQKRLRVSAKFQQHMREMKQLGDSIKGMHTDLARLNGLIAKNAKLQDDLANSNYTMETDFMNKLKELELDSVKLDASITRVKEEKESILQEIMEVEKQILLWEKKIQLERETQDALDPEYGQGEIKGMKKEIHRMKLRLQQLKRQQEKMCAEMERTVYKHDTIRIGVGTSTKEQKHVTTAVLNRKIGELKSGLTTHKRESKRVDGEIAEKDARRQELEDLVQSKQTVFTELEDKNTEIVNQIQESQFSQQMIKEQKEMYKLRSKRYDEAKSGVLKVRKSKDSIQDDLRGHEDRARRLHEAFIHLQEQLPAHQSYFRRLAALA